MCEAVAAIMARVPSEHGGKSRLAPVLRPDERRALQEAMLLDVLTAVAGVYEVEPVVAFHPPRARVAMGRLVGQRARLIEQRGRDLGERLASVAQAMFGSYRAVILVAADAPLIQSWHIREALSAIATHDACLGPTEDGGYYLIGLTRYAPAAFSNVDWGSECVAGQTLRALESLGLTRHILPALYDVDRPADVDRLRRDYESMAPVAGLHRPLRTRDVLRAMAAADAEEATPA